MTNLDQRYLHFKPRTAARASAASDYPSSVRSLRRMGFSGEAKKRAEKHAQKIPFRVKDGESKLGAAKRWLRTLLSSGPVYAGDVLDLGFVCGVPFLLLERAKVSLGVEFQPGNITKFACWRLWFWALPNDGDEEEIDED
jgi:hypothetical protein